MALFSKRCLEELREKVDLSEVISAYVPLKKAGGSYKGLCPFHNEKSPSFVVQNGDTHYHCFGCGAHGDAVSFLMNFLKLSFVECVEMLASRFGITLEYQEKEDGHKEPNLAPLKSALNMTREFYHFHLLHTEEGHRALEYLYKRGLDLPFIQAYQIGFSPSNEALTIAYYKEKKINKEILIEAGLAKEGPSGKLYPFFSSRIMFPIQDISGNVIGFSGRSIEPQVRGGKYINTPETPLFKKSKILFGLNYSRRRIAKDQKAIIVEGQIDALRLIHEGLNLTVAGQGTAFGAGHVEVLKKLGVEHVFLAFDGDEAGQAASVKVGQLFQKVGIEVSVAIFGPKEDPDAVLKEKGLEELMSILKAAKPYIEFIIERLSSKIKIDTPAGKNRVAKEASDMIRDWDHPLMIHEGLKQLAKLLNVPEAMMNPGAPSVQPKIFPSVHETKGEINVDRILECDLIRGLFLLKTADRQEVSRIVEMNLTDQMFRDKTCHKLYRHLLSLIKEQEKEKIDMFDLAEVLDKDEEFLIDQLVKKRVNIDRVKEGVLLAIEKILERGWMIERERIKGMIQKGDATEEEILALAKKFDQLKKEKPKVNL